MLPPTSCVALDGIICESRCHLLRTAKSTLSAIALDQDACDLRTKNLSLFRSYFYFDAS